MRVDLRNLCRSRRVPRSVAARVRTERLEERAVPTTFVVDEVSDVADGDYSAGHLSLREAVGLVNAGSAPYSTIAFDPAVFSAPQTVTLVGTPLVLGWNADIIGPAATLTLDASQSGRHLILSSSLHFITNLRLVNATNGSVWASGKGLTLDHVTITNNSTPQFGAAIRLGDFSTLSLIDCTITDNHAKSDSIGGGAISAGQQTSLTIVSTTIAGNSALAGGGAVSQEYALNLTVEDSTIANNTAGSGPTAKGGGGIYAYRVTTVLVKNSTISGNAAVHGSGGGLYVNSGYAATIHNSTITANSAADATTGMGGGVFVGWTEENGRALSLDSTVLAQNAAAAGGTDVALAYTGSLQGSYNLVGAADDGNFALSGNGNLTGSAAAPLDAKLGPLSDNGGPTRTRAPLPGSPTIDAGSNPAGLPTDQRGGGYARVSGPAPDIGALEVQNGGTAAKVSAVEINGGTAQRSRVTSLTVTFDQPVTLPGNPADAFQLTRQSPAGSVTLAAAAVGYAVTLTFTGGPVEFGSLADGRYTLTVLASEVSGGNFDGNGDGVGGDDYVLAGSPANGLFRLFGDADGDGDVDAVDYGAFRSAFGGTSAAFDFAGDGDVDALDFGQFRRRFETSV